MTLPIERARTRRPITWLTLVGVILLPVLIGGILVAALSNPTERLENISAAIVNNDKPVTIDGQLVPLGRQLTAGLIEGAGEGDGNSAGSETGNLGWVISNSADAAAGLADGTFSAVVTIPENFSAAATSTADADTATQAVIDVQTPKNSLLVDDAITTQVTQTAAAVMGTQLSQFYLENVFLGFTTLGDQLGEAADGAGKLASGARSAHDGAVSLGDGATALAGGASKIADGASSLGGGLDTLAGKTREASGGAAQLAAALNGIANQVAANPPMPPALVGLGAAVAGQTRGVSATLSALNASCLADTGGATAFCDKLAIAAQDATAAAGQAGALSGGLQQLADASGPATAELVGGLRTIAGQTQGLGSGLTQLGGGIDTAASGARDLANGATGLAGGATQLGTGAVSLADGIAALGDGANSLADGLDKATAALPAYDEQQRASLAEVVANPVKADSSGTSLFGASAIPLLSVLALWIGAIGTYIALQAATRRALTSRRPSALLALRGLAPGAAIGAVQGLLVAGVVQFAGSYAWGDWFGYAALCVLAGVVFAAVNQALVAAFGGAGRWVAALVAVLAVATGVVSTVPGVLSTIAGLMPTAPAYQAMVGVLAGAGGIGAGVAGLVIFALIAFAVTVFAVSRRRTVSAASLVAAAAAA